jgi:hypothetical protein
VHRDRRQRQADWQGQQENLCAAALLSSPPSCGRVAPPRLAWSPRIVSSPSPADAPSLPPQATS